MRLLQFWRRSADDPELARQLERELDLERERELERLASEEQLKLDVQRVIDGHVSRTDDEFYDDW